MTQDLRQDVLFGRQSNVSNYSGVFNSGENYKKFDFVYNTGDGLFYYAKEDLTAGGGVSVTASNRYHLVPFGPNSNHYVVDSFNRTDDLNATFSKGNIIDIAGSQQDNDGRYEIISVVKGADHVAPHLVPSQYTLTGAVLEVKPVSTQYSIENLEIASSNGITISTVSNDPSLNPDLWSSDRFFFDADYGSTVNFKANNVEMDFGNGYYSVTPKSINSLSMSVDMKFDNRSNREANAIVHFVENHLGQLEKDSPSPNLRYKQGISGFKWDGASSFHPYDTVENQLKTFYCTDINHQLSFEDSNNISLKLKNLDDSLLRKTVQGGWIVGGGDAYDPSEEYEKNDFALYTGNMQYYYWHDDSAGSNKSPAEARDSWTRTSGYFSDINTGHWTRDFLWKPSLGLSVSQSPRVNSIALKNGYTQIYDDGINESLLNLDLDFKNRSDSEARAILHFLEQRLGYLPFNFTPPAPYDTTQNFICQEWSHTYNYKDNHTISAKFAQFPFNMSQEQMDSNVTPPEVSEGELIFTSPLVFSKGTDRERISAGQKLKARLELENIGDLPVQLTSATLSDPSSFEILGDSSTTIPAVPYDLEPTGYLVTLPSQGFPLNLNGATVKLSKSYSPGIKEGGQLFSRMVSDGNGGWNYDTDGNGVRDAYFQNNLGEIKGGINTASPGEYVSCETFVSESLFAAQSISEIGGNKSAYIDILFKGKTSEELNHNLSPESATSPSYVSVSQTSYSSSGNGGATMTATWQSGSTWLIRYSSNHLNSSGDENNSNVLIRVPDITNASQSNTNPGGGGRFGYGGDANVISLYGDDDNEWVEILYTFSSSAGTIEGGSEGNGNHTQLDELASTASYYVSLSISNTGASNSTAQAQNLVDSSNNNLVVPGGNGYQYGEISIASSTNYSPQTGILKVYIDSLDFNVNSAGVTQPISDLTVGSTVGFVVVIDHQDRNSNEDSESYVKASFYHDFDGIDLVVGNVGRAITTVNKDHSQNHLVHAVYNKLAHWAVSAGGAWDGPGHIGDAVGAGNPNLENTAVMGGKSYKIRYRRVEKNNLPEGFSVASGAVVTASSADNTGRHRYHGNFGVIPPGQPFEGQYYDDVYLFVYQKKSTAQGGSKMFSFVEAYVHSVETSGSSAQQPVPDAPANTDDGDGDDDDD